MQARPSLTVNRTSEAAYSALTSPGAGSPDSPQSGGNPIGCLQEMATQNSWGPPTYDLVHEQGMAHEKKFVVECKVSATRGNDKKNVGI